MVDKEYCMSSYLAFRCILNDEKEFFTTTRHNNYYDEMISDKQKTAVYTAEDIDHALEKRIGAIRDKKLGLLLSGGMDSAVLASYVRGADAYTFRFLDGSFQQEELARAEYYAQHYGLTLHYVDIDFDIVKTSLSLLMAKKGAPVHSIEPQIYQAALQARKDNIDILLFGNSADPIFGGFNLLLAKDWKYHEFIQRYMYVDPSEVLKNPSDMTEVFLKYKREDDTIDYLKFLDDVYSLESNTSYINAFKTAGQQYLDPYAYFKMGTPLDLERIRSGESKYLIRELFRMKYPDRAVPEKVPMPRPVDVYFKDWGGPVRKEFRSDIDIKKYSGNQKWLLWCLERFLNEYDAQ